MASYMIWDTTWGLSSDDDDRCCNLQQLQKMEQIHKLDRGDSTAELQTSNSLREQYRTGKREGNDALTWIQFLREVGRNQLQTSNEATCHKHGASKRSKLQDAAKFHGLRRRS